MNATSLDELRNTQSAVTTAAEPTPTGDMRMEQIRELLIGDTLHAGAEKLTQLEARQKEFEEAVLQRLDLISQRLDALSRDVVTDRRSAFGELARAMHELGNRVRGI